MTKTFENAWSYAKRKDRALIERARGQIKKIIENPARAGDPKTGPLKGYRSIKFGHFTIVWLPSDEEVLFVALGGHDEAYREAQKEAARRAKGVQVTLPFDLGEVENSSL